MRQLGLRWVPEGPGAVDTFAARPALEAAAAVDAERALVVEGRISCKGENVRDPPLGKHDEAVLLLHAAAEIEHSLLVQYLYAAYSLETDPARLTNSGPAVPEDPANLVRMWRDTIVEIAVQEMGHLLTVQNLLRFIGGPLNFEREDIPFKADLYPFRFDLQPLTRGSLAKYIAAEMPDEPPHDIFPPDVRDDILKRLPREYACINRVGAVYTRLIKLFRMLDDRVLRPESIEFQARTREWGGDEAFLVHEISNREAALEALDAIGRQGEGWPGGGDPDTHFARFLRIYQHPAFPDELTRPPQPWIPVRPVPINPRTEPGPPGTVQIDHREALRWAQLFNVRYRMLLYTIHHSLCTGAASRRRRALISWSRHQMKSGLREIAIRLTRLPAGSAGGVAAPPFELPYTLAIPDREIDRWLLHRDMIEASRALLRAPLPPTDSDPILSRLEQLDHEMLKFIDEHKLDTPR